MKKIILIALLSALRMLASDAAIPSSETSVSRSEFEELKKQLQTVQGENAKLQAKVSPLSDSFAKAIDAKLGGNLPVTTKAGKLGISGFVQIWYYSIQNDHRALFDDHIVNDITDTNEASDNDSFRIRRTELRFTAEINKQLSAVIMIDPAREATSFPSFYTNQGLFKRLPNSATGSAVSGVQTGVGAAPRMLQDAYALYKDLFPHHDFQAGQYKAPFDEESFRSSATLDFAERSFIGQLGDARDLGAHIRGHWFEDRLQYWIGAFDAAGNYYMSGGQQQNRSDDNDDKDALFRILGRPVWNDPFWGDFEIGGAAQFGVHGESGGPNSIDFPVAGLNREHTFASRYTAWAYYAPGCDLKGLWLRGNYLWMKDRNAPSTVIDLLNQDIDGNGTQDNGNPFSSWAWNASIGYRFADAPWLKCAPKWVRNLEVLARYEAFQNVQVADLVKPNHTDVFTSRLITGGVNYYLTGNTKVQFNYTHVHNPDGEGVGFNRNFHQVRNNSILVNFQVAF